MVHSNRSVWGEVSSVIRRDFSECDLHPDPAMKGSIGRQSWEEEACLVWEMGKRKSLPDHFPSPAAVGLSYKGLPTLLPRRAAL